MGDLKEYFYNINHYSDPIIKKFIYDFTDKFNPFLLIALNKEFVLCYLLEMEELNELQGYKKEDIFENLFGKEELDKSTNILCRMYSYSEGVYKIEETLEQYCYLSYSYHRNMTSKIQDFQFCINEIVKAENSQLISQYNIIPEHKTSDLNEINNKDNLSNPFPLIFINKEVYDCFIEYTSKHILEFYSDYSYLKKRLESDQLIHYKKDNHFMEFLFTEAKLITEKNHENYTGKYEGKLKSLKRSYSEQRQNNFNNVFGHLVKPK